MPTDISSLPAGSLLSFGGAPCLKWKLAAAFKTHWDWNGFDPAISPPNKYLTRSVLFVEQAVVSGHLTTTTSLTALNQDRLTGQITGTPPPFGEGPIVAGTATITLTGDTQMFVDTGVFITGSAATLRQTWRINLSNPYTLAELEMDTDALIGGFNPDAVAPFTITPLAYPGESILDGLDGAVNALVRLMAPWSYPVLQTPTLGSPMPAPVLNAVAINAYNPSRFIQDFGSYGMGKLVGFLAMAGAYALTTHTVALDATDALTHPIGTPTCVDGRGSCSQYFKVAPPPLVANQESYVLAKPNCRCGNG